MRKISIVYKKPQSSNHLNQLPYHSASPSYPSRRSVDEYNNRLAEKQKRRDRIVSHQNLPMNRLKLRSSNLRNKDQYNIIDTLNIASAPLHGQQVNPNEDKKEQYRTQFKLLVARKLGSRPSLAGLDLVPDSMGPDEDEDSGAQSMHSKLRCLYRNKQCDNKKTVLAISVNFILNQHFFWGEEQIDESATKNWKLLQNYSNIVWVCSKEESLQKLMKFSKVNSLRLDGVYCIVARKNKRLLTVNYAPIQQDYGIRGSIVTSPLLVRQDRKLVTVTGLQVEQLEGLTYHSFYQAVPLVKNSRTVVHFAKINPADGFRFGAVMRILSQTVLPQPYNLMPILRSFENYIEESEQAQCSGCVLQLDVGGEKSVLQRLQEFKNETTTFFNRSLSMKLADRVSYDSSENSVQFMIGDCIRRNYRIFQQYRNFQEQHKYYVNHSKLHPTKHSSLKRKRQYSPNRYRNQIYLWNI